MLLPSAGWSLLFFMTFSSFLTSPVALSELGGRLHNPPISTFGRPSRLLHFENSAEMPLSPNPSCRFTTLFLLEPYANSLESEKFLLVIARGHPSKAFPLRTPPDPAQFLIEGPTGGHHFPYIRFVLSPRLFISLTGSFCNARCLQERGDLLFSAENRPDRASYSGARPIQFPCDPS